jgi:hypothetical protein
MNSDKYIIEQHVIKKMRTTNILLQRKNYSGQFYTNGKAQLIKKKSLNLIRFFNIRKRIIFTLKRDKMKYLKILKIK